MRTILLATLLALLAPAARAQFTHGALLQEEETVSVTDTNPVALWTFEDAANPATDSIGGYSLYERDGTFSWQNANPKVGSYNIYNTGDSSLTLTNNSAALRPESGGSFSALGWFQETTAAVSEHAFGVWDTTTGRAWTARNDGGTWKAQASTDGTTTTHEVGTTAATTSYQLVCVTFDNDANLLKISVNGGTYETISLTSELNAATCPFTVGGRLAAGVSSASFKGRIDQIRYFNRALSQAEVSYFYNSGTGR